MNKTYNKMTHQKKPTTKKVQATNQPKLRIMGLGGFEEVGKNMTLIEYGKEIILIDMGLQFPEEDQPGIDFIIPNTSYLEGREQDIKGVFITHGHYDHIGAISYLMPKLGNPPLYTGKLTAGLVKKRHEYHRNAPPLNIKICDENSVIKVGNFSVEFVPVNHSIPDSFGFLIHTPLGSVFHTGDYKIDFNPVDERPADLARFAKIGANGLLCLMADSTSSGHEGHQVSERIVGEELHKVFATTEGRIIVGTFASQISRVQQIFELAEKLDRRVMLEGRSMQSNVEIAHKLGYLKFKPKTLIKSPRELKNVPNHKLVIVGTGAQGERNAVLMRLANREHKYLDIQKGDTIIFSSSVIPGNERTIQNLKDILYRRGARVVHYKMMDIHAGGHAKKEDQKLLIRLLKPEYFIPIEGNHYLLCMHAETAQSVGVHKKKTFIADNGQVIEFQKVKIDNNYHVVGQLMKEKINVDPVLVDGLGVGDISSVVLRDRQLLAEDGMFVIIAQMDLKTGKVIGSPDIISRGFVYMKESQRLIQGARKIVKGIHNDKSIHLPVESKVVKEKIKDKVGEYLYKKTKKRPMVLTVLIEV